MKKNLRLIAMTLIATLALAGLTACGSANTNVESNGNKVDTVVNEIKNDDVVVSGNIGAATDVKVAELEEDSVEYVALASYLADKVTSYDAYDITITKDGAAVQPDGKVEVTIKLSDEMLAAAGNAYSVLYVNGAEVTKLDCTEKDGYITFATDHFSIYTVVKYETEGEVESEIEALPTETPTPIPVHKHSYTEVEGSAVEATCTTDGKTADKVCECGEKVEGDVVKAPGHNYESVANSTANPTCEKDGKKEDTKCSLCGNTINGETIPATGHSYGNYVYNNDAAVGKDGTETAKCSTCGKTKTRTKEGTALTPNYVGYDEFGNGYTLDGKGDKVFYVKNPYPIKQAVWVSDKEVYFYNIFGQASIEASLGREMAEKNGIPWDQRIQSEITRLGYYDGQMVLKVRIYMN